MRPMLKHPLKIFICSYLAAMALVSDAAEKPEQFTIDMPVQCLKGVDIVQAYKELGGYVPLMVSSVDNRVTVTFIGTDTGVTHTWLVLPDPGVSTGVACLLDQSMLKGFNTDALVRGKRS